MKILLDGRLISDKPTGISRYSREVIKIYQNYYGYENVQVIVNEKLDDKPFKIIETKLKPFRLIDFFIFHRFLKKIDADIYHTLYHSNSFIKDKNKLYITTFHDIGHKVLKSRINDSSVKDIFIKLGIEIIIRKTLKNSEKLISVSETTKRDINKIYKYDSIVIPEGVNKIEIKDKEVKILKNIDYFLYVGNSRPTKNLKFLINTFLELDINYKLVLVGNGNNLKVNNSKIIQLGFVEDRELSWLYKNCEAFLFPSLYEGFGLPVLEAIYKGSKVYCSNGGSLKEFSEKLVRKFNPYKKEELKKLLITTKKIEFNKKEQEEELKKYNWKNIEKIMIKKLFKIL